MELDRRKELLGQLKTEVVKYVEAERKRLRDERIFLEAIKDRTIKKAEAPYAEGTAKIATEYVKTLVGLDESFDPDAGVT